MISSDDKAELLNFMRREIASMMNIVLNGQTVNAQTDTESIGAMFPGMPTVQDRPLVQPYGFHSLAPDGTLSINARVGAHFGSRYVIGHRDSRRPTIGTGESVQYSFGGYRIRVFNDSIQLGKGDVYETAVVGNTLAALLGAMLDAIALHGHPAFGAPPANAAVFTALKATYVDSGKILAQDGGGF